MRYRNSLQYVLAFVLWTGCLAALGQTPPACTVSFPYSEGFNASSISNCWSQLQVAGLSSSYGTITAVANSQGPTIQSPNEGSHMLRFRSNFASSGVQTRLMSSPFSTVGKADITVKFQWWHTSESAFSAYNDRVQVQYSTNGTTWTNAGSEIRVYNAASNGWSEKTIVLPVGAENNAKLYIGFLFTSGYGANCYFDKFSVNASASTAPLPIALTDFQAKNINNRYAAISWMTHSEMNSDYFVVERSANGKDFSPVEKLKAAGSSNILLKYAVYDQFPVFGISYYRLKEVDFDGKITCSELQSVYFGGSESAAALSPNPAQHGSSLLLEADKDENVSIRVIALNGKIVETLEHTLDKGLNAIFIGEQLPAGMYQVLVSGDRLNCSLKLVVSQ